MRAIMRSTLPVIAGAILLASLPALAQDTEQLPYRIDFNPAEDVSQLDRYKGEEKLFLNVKFLVTPEKAAVEKVGKYKIVIEEEGKFVRELDVIPPPADEELSVVLAMDISGSMTKFGRIEQARRAAAVFFDPQRGLPARADCGLILFNHKVAESRTPSSDRAALQKLIAAATPNGGTAYLDATDKAIDMLKPFTSKSKAVVLMTDGVDINSDKTLEDVIAKAKAANVRVYTIGLGEPGKQDRVTSVLVLDRSGSMNLPANNQDKRAKILALRDAASRFVNSIGSTRRSTILKFSDSVELPKEFTNDKRRLKRQIADIDAQGETAVFDAVYTAVGILDAEGAPGKRAVVAMTDGIDNSSRRRVDEVIARAKEAKIPLYMLGFGRKGELDLTTMQNMADKTGGKFYHAENEQALVQLFENLSIQLHDDGIDEKSLIQLATATKGTYSPAKNLDKLDFILQKVTKLIQATPYDVTFPSLRQVKDGLTRHITLKLVSGTGQVVAEKEGVTQVRGLVIAEMTPLVYLGLLGILGVLIALPGMLRRRSSY
jgi:VWFA-related protein